MVSKVEPQTQGRPEQVEGRISEDSFKDSGLNIKEAPKAIDLSKTEPRPVAKPINEFQLKDIPIEEDTIDLRKIAEG